MRAKPDRELSNQVIESRLAGVVSLATFLRRHGVGRTRKHHGCGQPLIFEYPLCLLCKKIVSGDVYEKCLCPLRICEFAVGAGYGIDRCRVNDDIQAAKLRYRKMCRFCNGGRRTEVNPSVREKFGRRNRTGFVNNVTGALLVKVSYQNMSALSREQ